MFARFSRLALERLDDRNAPSSLPGNDVATADWMPEQTITANWSLASTGSEQDQENETPTNQSPVIVNFRVVVGTGWLATYSGTVVDENPAGLAVKLTGNQGCLGSGQPVITDANGNFTFTGSVQQTVDTGWAFADATDAQGLVAEQKGFWVTV